MQTLPIQSFQDLIAWKKAMEFVVFVYKLTAKFPKEELYGLTSQLRRAAVSIPSNIAEGWKRFHIKEYSHFLDIANGSSAEAQTQLLISKELGYISQEEFDHATDLLVQIEKLLSVYLRKLRKKHA